MLIVFSVGSAEHRNIALRAKLQSVFQCYFS